MNTRLRALFCDHLSIMRGKYLPGSRIVVRAPEALLEEMPEYTILLPWNFRDEILAQQAEYRARGGRFIVPVPRPEVV